MDSFLSEEHNHKFIYFMIGFLTVLAIVFSFQFLGTKIPGLKDNYLNLFCANIK
jgi:hypothetical protein